MAVKRILGYLNAENELASAVVAAAEGYERNGADGLFLYHYAQGEKEREEFLLTLRETVKQTDIPILAGFCVRKLEDVKKVLYTGVRGLVIPYRKLPDLSVVKEAAARFGKDKLWLEFDVSEENNEGLLRDDTLAEAVREAGAAGFLLKHLDVSAANAKRVLQLQLPVLVRDSLVRNDMEKLLRMENVIGVATNRYQKKNIYQIKQLLADAQLPVAALTSALSFSELKTNADGLIPVIAQDDRTGEVLQLAYMNREAFEQTAATGRMTYFSRSRQQLWVKGETSGHYQFVKALYADCDKDTLLAQVHQVGAACHTGAHSCFYTQLFEKEREKKNPTRVLTELYETIVDRKEQPREGSYTNYLFTQGIDKILKKCGEEAAEIIIAAKNPQPEEIKYEIADYLYHLTVLMVERGVDWQEILLELDNRRK